MRIVLDLQGTQAEGRFRGVGRYTRALTEAIIRQAGEHEVLLALNAGFPETIEPLRATFQHLLPTGAIRVWRTLEPPDVDNPDNPWRRAAAERLREAFLAGLSADLVHVASVFEGFVDAAITGFGHFADAPPSAAMLYDLTPLFMPETYLSHAGVAAWYRQKLQVLRRARLWLTISEGSRRDGIERLGLPAEWVVNISAAADARFRPVDLAPDRLAELRRRYSLDRPFVCYVGGIDPHKNIDGLIRAFARLPPELRCRHQLLLAGPSYPGGVSLLQGVIAKSGLTPRDVRMVGLVPDDDLVALLNACSVFIYPSRREGFGLPLLEAMACGAAAIASDASSLPEILGRTDALFDPESDEDMARVLYAVLSDGGFRAELRAYGPRRAKDFSWSESARRAVAAFERLHAREKWDRQSRVAVAPQGCPLLAYVAPWPIVAGTREILCALARTYEIEIVIEDVSADGQKDVAGFIVRGLTWFDRHAERYDRIVYDLGAAPSCRRMPLLAARHPGVVVHRDFFLGALFAALEADGADPHAWSRALYEAHGYDAVRARIDGAGPDDLVARYPCGLGVLQRALGSIVHADEPRLAAAAWYGEDAVRDWTRIPAGAAAEEAADAYVEAVERAYHAASSPVALAASIAAMTPPPADEAAWLAVAAAMAANAETRPAPPRLLVDVTVQVLDLEGSGIARVVRKITGEWLANPPEGYRVEPVYTAPGGPYRYARRFTLRMLGHPEEGFDDDVVEARPGDCFVGLDLLHCAPSVAAFFADLRRIGGRTLFIVYDLLPLYRPDWFPPGIAEAHRAWFETIAEADGLLCISRAVADEVLAELDRLAPERHQPLRIGWFHLGSDIISESTEARFPSAIEETLASLRRRPTILMVSVIYPRKGHEQALAAFERLWAAGLEPSLVIAGSLGWHMDEFGETLRRHPEAGRRLFWFNRPRDALLSQIYQSAAGVLMPTEGEGFGLPLIEAAHYGVPVLARDLPVLREIAGDSIAYFSGLEPEDLAAALARWIAALAAGTAPSPGDIPRQSWADSARQAAGFITTDAAYASWPTHGRRALEAGVIREATAEFRDPVPPYPIGPQLTRRP